MTNLAKQSCLEPLLDGKTLLLCNFFTMDFFWNRSCVRLKRTYLSPSVAAAVLITIILNNCDCWFWRV
jgi:hypothetical protein